MTPIASGILRNRFVNRLLGPVIVLVLGLLAYSNSLRGDFVFDSIGGVRDKLLLRDLANYTARWDGYLDHPGRWFGYLTFALNHRLGGLDPTGFHAVNVAIHLGTALLLHELVLLAFRTPRLAESALRRHAPAIAFSAAALFVSHPLQTQAVTYIVQRFTSLATFMYLATVVQYARLRVRRGAGASSALGGAVSWAGVLATALLAMKTKEIAITLPLAIVLYDLAFFHDRWGRRLAFLTPVLVTLPVIPLGMMSFSGSVGQVLAEATQASRVQTTLSRGSYLATELPVLTSYLRLLVWPAGQSVDHAVTIHHSFASLHVLGSGLVLLAGLGLAAYLAWGASRRGSRALDPAALLAAYGIAWFFLTISVESSIIPIVDPMFEHRMYLPSAGIFAAVAVGGMALARRLAPAHSERVLACAALAFASALAITTFVRNRVWADELTLWSDAVEKAPTKARPRQNLGVALVGAGRNAEAVEQFFVAAQLDPTNVEFYSNLGAALEDLGRRPEAVAWLDAALRAQPDHPDACYNLGRIAFSEGDLERATELFQRALKKRPDFPQASATLAGALNRQHRHAEAIALIRGGGPRISTVPEARFNLGVALAATGDLDAAAAEARALERQSPSLAAQLTQYIQSRGPSR